MSRTSKRALLIPFCIAAACGGHRVAHVAPDESRPHITWEIRSGGDRGDEELVCGSLQPSQECVLVASTADRRSLVTVHLYMHAAKEPTNYLGVMQVPFMEGSERLKDKEVSATVPLGSQPVGSTLNGLVTSKAGRYSFRILLDAIQTNSSTSQRIEAQANVLVKRAETMSFGITLQSAINHLLMPGLGPIWWTSFQRGIRCPNRWPTLPSDDPVASSRMNSKPAPCAWSSTKARRSAPRRVIWT